MGLRRNDHDVTDSPAFYYDIFVDLYLLNLSSCLVYGRGGYGQWANLLSANSSCSVSYFRNRKYFFDLKQRPEPKGK